MKTNGSWINNNSNVPNLPCQTILIWQELDNDLVAGAVGGKVKGAIDKFLADRFVARIYKNNLSLLYINKHDLLTGEEMTFKDFDSSVLRTANKALSQIWHWNSKKNWESSKLLMLKPELVSELNHINNIFTLQDGSPAWEESLYSKLRLASSKYLLLAKAS